MRPTKGERIINSEDPSKESSARLFDPFPNLSGIGEEELSSLVRRRAQPGILILDLEGKILYLNVDAKVLLKKLMTKTQSFVPGSVRNLSTIRPEKDSVLDKRARGGDDSFPVLPEIIYQLHEHSAKFISFQRDDLGETEPTVNRICIHDGVVYLLRALPLQQYSSERARSDIMILIERVSQGLRTDQIVGRAKLTPRESEVVSFLLEGKTNKEIAVCINIGEYTVKDHIKRIMRKHDVTTRAGIVAKVLQSHFPAFPPSFEGLDA